LRFSLQTITSEVSASEHAFLCSSGAPMHWGRPVGVGVTHDGSLLVSDDGGNSIWRVSYKGK
jgi:glucose/arabinose dehydrogenase